MLQRRRIQPGQGRSADQKHASHRQAVRIQAQRTADILGDQQARQEGRGVGGGELAAEQSAAALEQTVQHRDLREFAEPFEAFLEGAAANTMIRLMEAFEEHDDVQNVHSNFDIDQKLLEEVAG